MGRVLTYLSKRTFEAALALGLVAVWVSVRPAHAGGPVFNNPARSSLARPIPGKELTPFVGTENGKLRLYADWGEGLKPIPFQVDEVRPDGLYVLDGIANDPPDEKPGAFDENDELVFLLRDAGYKVHRGHWPSGFKQGREVELNDPQLSGRRGYVYLFSFDDPPPPSPARYVHYNAAADSAESDAIRVGFMKSAPFVFDEIGLSDYQGGARGSGKKVNLIDRLKVRQTARALGETIEVKLNEENFQSRLVGMHVGPVRIIRHVIATVKIGPMPEIAAQVIYKFTPRTARVVVAFRPPGAVTQFLSDMDMIIGVDFRDLRGTTFSTLALNQGTIVDGKLSAVEEKIPLGNEEWIMLTGKGLNVFGVIDLEKDLPLRKEVHFLDNPSTPFPPETVPGQLPEVGFRFLNWTALEGRTYKFEATISALEGFPLGGGSGFYKGIHRLPELRLSPGAGPGVTLVHGPSTSEEILNALEGVLQQSAQGPLQGLRVQRLATGTSARENDLERVAASAPDVAVFLTDVNPGLLRERIERRGIRAVTAAVKGNAGGAADVPPDRVIAMLRQSVREGTNVLFLTGPDGTKKLWPAYEEAAKAGGVSLKHVTLPASGSLGASLTQAAAGAGAVLVVPDAYFSDGGYRRFSEALAVIAKLDTPLPVFATGREAVEKGAVLGLGLAAGVSPSVVAGQVVGALQGRKIESVDAGAGASATTEFYVNLDTLKWGRFQLPLQILKNAKRVGAGS